MGHGDGGRLTPGNPDGRRDRIYLSWRPNLPIPHAQQERYAWAMARGESTNAACEFAGVNNATGRRWEDDEVIWPRIEARAQYILEHAARSLPRPEQMLIDIWSDANKAIEEGSFKAGLEAKLKVYEIARHAPGRDTIDLSKPLGKGDEDLASELDTALAIMTSGEED